MSYYVESYPAGTFSWADFFSHNREASRNFYEKLFDWESKDIPTGPERPDYTMFYLQNKLVAGGSPAFDPNMPSYWASYISVEDIDSVVKTAADIGGRILMEPMDVMQSGKLATIQDPTGAAVSLWQPKSHIGAEIVNTTGAMVWNELNTRDVEGAKSFYGNLLGWTFEKDDTGYITIKNGSRWNGGMFEITPEMGDFPPYWAVYFTVDNIDTSIEIVTTLGGKILMPKKEIGPGKISMISCPAGTACMLIEMNDEPEHWVNEIH